MMHPRSYPTGPDWSTAQSWIFLAWLLLVLPPITLSLILLYRRRSTWPIAGRGFVPLAAVGASEWLATVAGCVQGLLYPDGIPCSMLLLTVLATCMPPAFAYVTRGWILVFKLSIMSYLAETQWRKEKMQKLRKMMDEHGTARDTPPAGAAAASEAGSSEHRVDTAIASLTEAYDAAVAQSLTSDSATHGYWFTTHRSWTEFRAILRAHLLLGLVFTAAMFQLAFWDPDPVMTRDYFLARQDALRDSGWTEPIAMKTHSQFTAEGLSSGPVCLLYSAKVHAFYGTMVFAAFICGAWIVLHLTRCHWAKAARLAEQADLAALEKLFESGVEGASSPSKLDSKGGVAQVDDAFEQLLELGAVIVATGAFMASFYPFHVLAPGLYPLGLCACLALLTNIITQWRPLYLSFAISAQRRRFMAAHGQTKGGRVEAKLPHQQSYYSLNYILRSAHTYPALLAFLRKEFSSESALFWTASREFTRAVNALTASCPQWPGGGGVLEDSSDASSAFLSDDQVGLSRTAKPSRKPLNIAGSSPSVAPGMPAPNSVVAREDALPPLVLPPPGLPAPRRPSRMATHSHVSQLSRSPNAAGANAGVPPSPLRSSFAPAAVVASPSAASAPALAPVDFVALHAEAQRVHTLALEINEKYLIPSAELQVNVSTDLYSLVASQIAQLTQWQPTPRNAAGEPDTSSYPAPPPFPLRLLYSQTELAVFELLQKDSFRRFLLTTEFAQLILAADEAELVRMEKQQLNDAEVSAVLQKADHALGTNTGASRDRAGSKADSSSRVKLSGNLRRQVSESPGRGAVAVAITLSPPADGISGESTPVTPLDDVVAFQHDSARPPAMADLHSAVTPGPSPHTPLQSPMTPTTPLLLPGQSPEIDE